MSDIRVLSRLGVCHECRRFGYIDPDGAGAGYCVKCWVEDSLEYGKEYNLGDWQVEIIDE